MNTGIYTITAPSGHQYVGSAIDFPMRWGQHRYRFRRGTHRNRVLQAAWNKYGDALIFAKLLICARSDLLFYEQRTIDTLRPKYNLLPTAGSSLGMRHTSEAKARIAAGQRG